MNGPPPAPLRPLGFDDPPRMMVQRCGTREWGLMAWEAWVSCGPMRVAGEHGTYAWSRKGAERKAARLMRAYLKRRRPAPVEIAKGGES